MILAVAKLHESFVGRVMIAIGSSAIEPEAYGRNLIDFARGLPEVPFESVPIGVMETLENDAQTIIRELDRSEGMVHQGFEGVLMSQSPVLDIHFAVVAFGKDKGDPGSGEEAVGDPFVEVVIAEVAVEESRQAHLLDHAKEEGDVIDAFVLQGQECVCHEAQGTPAARRGQKNRQTLNEYRYTHILYNT
jgi:hypothetical protein